MTPDVQLKGGGGGGDVHAAAQHGTAGSGGALPHLDQIQASFGRHDVSNVQAYQGGAAKEANAAMGAQAYATGNKVAFGGSASLHTAAHEAAHVVQQRAGVSLSGGVGKAGDSYEQHADQVADLVVQGKSAEGALDKMAGGSGAGAGGAIQKETDPKSRAEWNKAYTDLKSSSLWLFNRQQAYARSWQTTAEKVDPPPAWQTALKVVGSAVLAGALGGIGGAVAAAVVKETMKAVTKRLIEGAIEAGKKAVEEGVGLVAGGGSDPAAVVQSFCDQQAESMAKAGDEADTRLSNEAGNAAAPKMSTAEMQDLTKANKAAGGDKSLMHREMTIGLMNFISVGGTDGAGLKKADVEDTSLKGVLGLVIKGTNGKPTEILRAEADGINSHVKASMTGKLGDWLNDGGKRKKGVQITVKPKWHEFTVDAGAKAKLLAAGQYNSGTVAANKGSVYFAFGRKADGSYTYTDTDADYTYDQGWGANAGRWFLNNIKSSHQIVSEMRGLKLPKVS